MIKRALISVSNKEGIVELANKLVDLNIEIISTGGTAALLRQANIKVKDVSEITSFPECLDGRVKTLHPAIHGGILAIRDRVDHMNTLDTLKIGPIDLLIVNLYPFKETIEKDAVTLEEAIENIDIGGPAMLRAAAKNYQDVTVLIHREDYDKIIEEIEQNGDTTLKTRAELALKAFEHTAHYDSLVSTFLRKGMDCTRTFPEKLTLTYEKVQDLRYGENPHQRAAFYKEIGSQSGTFVDGIQLQGKELSFNNINDANGALELLKEFEEPTVVAVKHTNPCGVASDEDIEKAWHKAYESDPLSIFGGIIAANRPITKHMAEDMKEIFLEVIIAPDFTVEALAILKEKPSLRLIKIEHLIQSENKGLQLKKVQGGILVQEEDQLLLDKIEISTDQSPAAEEIEDLLFAFKVVKHVKSNGIVIAKNKQTLGIGPGQTSRIWALKDAIRNSTHALEDSVMASDAFFPFEDCVGEAAKVGIKAIIQPGGSLKDKDSIAACNKYGISMIFTGTRHFKH